MASPPRAPAPGHKPTHTIRALATLTPPSISRTWQTAPHPSQPIVATACSDRSVRVYSLTSFTILQSITGGHKRSVRSVSWKPHVQGQDVLATGSFDASAGIWRHAQHRLEREITSSTGVDDDDEDDEDEYQFACILDGHESEIKSLSWSPSGQYLATCSRDKSVWIWEELEEDNFETVAVLQEHDGDVKCVAWHPEEDLLVSASYDDTVRLYREDADDWVQVACITGHKKTVWWAEFEGSGMAKRDFRVKRLASMHEQQARYIEELERSGPRLATCSDDMSIRIWRRKARDGGYSAKDGMPSIIRSAAVDEDWYEEAVLPQAHERAVYSFSWSRGTGMIVSAGSDGKIIVYKERWKTSPSAQTEADGDTAVPDADAPLTEWVVVAELFSAHDVFEINHVVWADRADKGKREGEEVILSTGDDGEVRVWVLDEQGVEDEKKEGTAPS